MDIIKVRSIAEKIRQKRNTQIRVMGVITWQENLESILRRKDWRKM